jgi:O-antigen/teichoic acid export membrane protein
MKFSQHIGKGSWGFGSKLMPALYGIVTVLIIKSLVKEEYGELVLFQTLFGMIFTFSDNFALQSIVKFGVEENNDLHEVLSASSILFFGFLFFSLGAFALFPSQIGSLLNSSALPMLVPYLIILVIVTIPRVLVSKVFQMRFHTKELFIVDAINFGLASVIVLILALTHHLSTAVDVIHITIICGALSSVVGMLIARDIKLWKMRYSRPMLKKIFHFTRYQTATGTVHVFQQNLDNLLVPAFIGIEALASYNTAKIFFRGFDVLRETQGMFVFPATSKYYSRGDIPTLKKIIEKAVSFSYLAMIPIALLLVFFAGDIFHILYGNKYDESIPLFQLLLISTLFLPMVMVGMSSMVGIGRVSEVFKIISGSLVLNSIAAVILLPAIGSEGAAISYSFAMAFQAFFVYRSLRQVVPLEPGSLLFRGIADAKNFLGERKLQ